MADPASFARLVPGFDFLQGLMKGAGDSLPGMGQWIAPSLDPEEIDKRIRDLRTVQFWLEQNAKMIGATIQALEVQRMTLNTLQGMNVPLEALREAMTMKPAAAAAEAAPPVPAPAPAPAVSPPPAAPEDAPAPPKAPGVDPMAWWGALTQQFGELAANAMKDLPAAAASAASAVTAAATSASAAAAAPGAAPAAGKAAPRSGGKAAAKASGRAPGKASAKAARKAPATPARTRR
jgi:hypothetical protein